LNSLTSEESARGVLQTPNMNLPTNPYSNIDGISDQEKATEKFQSAYRDMRAQLIVPEFIPVLCAHEAAHAVYFTLAGMKEFEPLPARIVYDPKIDDYVGYLAAIQVLDLPEWTPGDFRKWLFNIARAHAAGEVVARKLMPSSDGGDENDRERFKKLCDKFNQDPSVNIDFELWWKLAQDSITEDLTKPEILNTIKVEALKLQTQFGL
jgi:hypothetical protein